MSIWILIFLILIAIYNTAHRFFPKNLQETSPFKELAILAAITLLISTSLQLINKYKDESYAYVSKEGKILKSKNFPYLITKTFDSEKRIVFIINERYGDWTDVKIFPENKLTEFKVYNAIDGVGIRFLCPESALTNFKIKIKK